MDNDLSITFTNYSSLLKYITSKYGNCYNNPTFYAKVNQWLEWYKGFVPSVHTTKISNGLTAPTRELYKLNMAKRVCEDWASSLLNEDAVITINSTNKKSSVFVQGSKGNGGVLGSNDFENTLSDIIEQTFALGTGAFVVSLDNVGVNEDGSIALADEATIKIRGYNATSILPISYEGKTITECAFLSTKSVRGELYYIISTHILEDGLYTIHNDILSKSFQPVELDELNLLSTIKTNSPTPLFSIIRTNIVNNIDLNSPLGISIYANAIDNLKCCDIAYDSCMREVITGQRIVMMNKCLLTTDENGRPVAPQDVKQTYMQFFGDDANSDIKEYIKEFHPSLNTDALDKELQNQLNMLSDKVGLGVGYYKFDGSSIQTATEYVGNKNDFMRNAKKMSKSVRNGIKCLVKSILFVGKNILDANVDDNAKIDVVVADGVIEDDTAKREQDRKDVELGIMSKAEYRAKWYGETLDEANAVLSEINTQNQVNE